LIPSSIPLIDRLALSRRGRTGPSRNGHTQENKAAAAQPASDAVGIADFVPPRIPVPLLLLVFLKLGAISVGGRSSSYMLDELVYRRGWLLREHHLEGHLVGKVLPGASGVGNAIFNAQLLSGSGGAAAALAVYLVPGALVGLVLSYLFFSVERPAWADAAIHGLSVGALGLFGYTVMRNLTVSRKTRLGPVVVAAAFVGQALLHLDLILVLVAVGAVSFLANLPIGERSKADGHHH